MKEVIEKIFNMDEEDFREFFEWAQSNFESDIVARGRPSKSSRFWYKHALNAKKYRAEFSKFRANCRAFSRAYKETLEEFKTRAIEGGESVESFRKLKKS